jgi:hypothetical protein
LWEVGLHIVGRNNYRELFHASLFVLNDNLYGA